MTPQEKICYQKLLMTFSEVCIYEILNLNAILKWGVFFLPFDYQKCNDNRSLQNALCECFGKKIFESFGFLLKKSNFDYSNESSHSFMI